MSEDGNEPPIGDLTPEEQEQRRRENRAALLAMLQNAKKEGDDLIAETRAKEGWVKVDSPEQAEAILAGRAALEGAEIVDLAEVKAKGGTRRRKKGAAAGGGDGGAAAEAPPAEPKLYKKLMRPRIGRDDQLQWVLATWLGDDCPVEPLGYDGQVNYFLNPGGQLISLDAAKMGKTHLLGLFGSRSDWLTREFPQINQHGTWKGFSNDFAAMALIRAASDKGIFDATDKVRGLGCWVDRQGRLVQHLGSRILIDGKAVKPGERDGYVYPGRPKVSDPDNGKDALALCDQVLRTFETWRYSRGALDARLLLGFIGCSILGAALEWRPMVFITGDAGTGKSTLMNYIKAMLPGRLVSTVDATPAALTRIINQDCVGVLFDEIEADVTSDSAQQVMKLARIAASGGTKYRSSSNHEKHEFTLRSCFAFSAIVPPSMRGADMQRMAFLRLQPLAADQAALPELTPAQAEALGNAIAGRITAAWPRFKETLRVFRDALMEQGHDKRSGMQFGTLLAAADLILEDEPATADWAAKFAEKLPKKELFEYENNAPEWLKAFNRILAFQPDAWRSDGSPTVHQVLRKMLTKKYRSDDWSKYANKLERAGLAVVVDQKNGHQFLAIPPRHPAMTKIFAGTDLQERGGDGAWSTVLRNAAVYRSRDADGREIDPQGVYRVDKVPRLGRVKCTQYWLDATYEGEPIFTRQMDDDAQLLNDCDGKL